MCISGSNSGLSLLFTCSIFFFFLSLVSICHRLAPLKPQQCYLHTNLATQSPLVGSSPWSPGAEAWPCHQKPQDQPVLPGSLFMPAAPHPYRGCPRQVVGRPVGGMQADFWPLPAGAEPWGGWSRLSWPLCGCLAPGLHWRLLPGPGKQGQATPPGPSLSRQKVLRVQPGAEATTLPPFWEQAPFCPSCQEATLGKDGLPSGPSSSFPASGCAPRKCSTCHSSGLAEEPRVPCAGDRVALRRGEFTCSHLQASSRRCKMRLSWPQSLGSGTTCEPCSASASGNGRSTLPGVM